MFFVFLSLVEFAAVNSYMRQSEKYEKMANSIEKQKCELAFYNLKKFVCEIYNNVIII